MRRYLDYYLSAMKVAILEQLQYRVANYLYLFGMIAESIIYMVVWSTVASMPIRSARAMAKSWEDSPILTTGMVDISLAADRAGSEKQ